MTTRLQKTANAYHSFFSTSLPNIAFSPITSTCTSSMNHMSNQADDAAAFCVPVAACFTTCMLMPVLLPATLITSVFSLLLGIAAGVAAPFVLGAAAIADCVSCPTTGNMKR